MSNRKRAERIVGSKRPAEKLPPEKMLGLFKAAAEQMREHVTHEGSTLGPADFVQTPPVAARGLSLEKNNGIRDNDEDKYDALPAPYKQGRREVLAITQRFFDELDSPTLSPDAKIWLMERAHEAGLWRWRGKHWKPDEDAKLFEEALRRP